MEIFLKTEEHKISIVLKNSALADHICGVLPFKITASLWEKEIYLELPSKLDINIDEQAFAIEVETGTVAYWLEGNCLCVFFGPNLIKVNHEPFSSRKVMVVGKVENSIHLLDTIKAHQLVEIVKN